MDTYDKVCGSLIGGASGDALGYAVEFLSEEAIFSHYGPSGISSYDYKDHIARISDDTQMTLFTAEGLLQSREKSSASYLGSIRNMYLCWYRTQTDRLHFHEAHMESRLMAIPALYEQRAPGGTCLSALAEGGQGTLTHRINDSKGCGGVMRVAPIALYNDTGLTDDELDLLGASAAAITHTHPLGYIPAAAMVHIIRKLLIAPGCSISSAVNEAVDACRRLFADKKHIDEFVSIMALAQRLAADKSVTDLEAIHQLGEGWVAEETLAIACYCAMRYEEERDFDAALRASVNHKGDSDSTGAVTGNIMGAYVGFEAIPDKYKDGLEMYGLLLTIGDELSEGEELE